MECWSIVFVIACNRFCAPGYKLNSLTRNPESKNRNVSFQYSSTPVLQYSTVRSSENPKSQIPHSAFRIPNSNHSAPVTMA
jgi:hypothetical protein